MIPAVRNDANSENYYRKVKQRCLLVADEFGRFVRALRITMAGAAMTGFHFTFFLESPSNGPRSLTDQRL